MRTGGVPSNTKESIATFMKYSAHTVYLVSYPDVQQQTDRSNCGLLDWHLYIPLVKTITLQEWHIVETLSIPILFMYLEKENITSFESGQSLYSLAHLWSLDSKLCRLPDSCESMDLCSNCKACYCYTCVGIFPGTKMIGHWSIVIVEYHISSEIKKKKEI